MERYLAKTEVGACAHLPKFWELVDEEDVDGLKILLISSRDSEIEVKPVWKLRHMASGLKIKHYGTMTRERLIIEIKAALK